MQSVPLHHQNNPKFTRLASLMQHNLRYTEIDLETIKRELVEARQRKR